VLNKLFGTLIETFFLFLTDRFIIKIRNTVVEAAFHQAIVHPESVQTFTRVKEEVTKVKRTEESLSFAWNPEPA
jgi:hypothetical protein